MQKKRGVYTELTEGFYTVYHEEFERSLPSVPNFRQPRQTWRQQTDQLKGVGTIFRLINACKNFRIASFSEGLESATFIAKIYSL